MEYMVALRAATKEFFRSGPGADPYSCYPKMHTGQTLKEFVECGDCTKAYPKNVQVLLKDKKGNYQSKTKGRLLCTLMKNIKGNDFLDSYFWKADYGSSLELKEGSPGIHR